MNILVTGASGFIGSAIARRLVADGYPVSVLVRKRSNLDALRDVVDKLDIRYGDVTDSDSLLTATQHVTHIYHAAGKAYIGPGKSHELYAVNVVGSQNLFNAALKNKVKRVVFTSSVSAIGITGTKSPADETLSWNLENLRVDYYKTKHLAELEAARAVENGLDCVIVNPSYVFGAGDVNFNAGRLIKDLYYHKVPVYPTGGICFADIDDVVQGHLAAMEKGRTGERYILGGENLTYKQVFDSICDVIGAPKVFVPITESVVKLFVALTARARRLRRITALANREILLTATKYFYYSSEKAKQELGFANTKSIGDAVQESIARAFHWYKLHQLL